MKRYKAIAATTNKTIKSWGGTSEFTHNALIQLMATAKGKPILLDFDSEKELGNIESANVIDNKLEIIFNLNCDIVSPRYRCVPGYQVNTDKWKEGENIHRIIDNVVMISCGLTMNPVEIDLPEIEKIKE